MNIREWQERVGNWAVSKGWSTGRGCALNTKTDNEAQRKIAETMSLIGVLTEYIEALRRSPKGTLNDPQAQMINRILRSTTTLRQKDATAAALAALTCDGIRVRSLLALIATELSEADKALLAGDFDLGSKDSFPAELADVGIRLLQLCWSMDIDLEAAIEAKMKINDARPVRHGGKHA